MSIQIYQLSYMEVNYMNISSSDNKRSVNVGSSDILFALYSTIVVRLEKKQKNIAHAIAFLKSGKSDPKEALETAREFNIIRDALSQISPEELVFDMRDLSKKAPWINNISPVVTSCGNLFTTSDGKDLLFEIVSIFTYAYYSGTTISIL